MSSGIYERHNIPFNCQSLNEGSFQNTVSPVRLLIYTFLLSEIDEPFFFFAEDREPNPHDRGRHKLSIDTDKLQHLIKMEFSVKKTASEGLLGGKVHPNTLYL